MEGLISNQVVEECVSTNDLARRLGEAGYPHGTWISARRQTGGRGRLGREWRSQEGNLFLSVLVRPERPETWTWIPLAAAAGVADELGRRFPEKNARIKWPNDLWIAGAKLGGILCEGVGNRAGSFIVIGLGLNCESAPEGIDQPAARLGGSADDVRAPLLAAVLAAVERLHSQGPAAVAELYARYAALVPGTPIRWTGGGSAREGDVIGLGPSGELRVRLREGGETGLFAEDVSVRPAS